MLIQPSHILIVVVYLATCFQCTMPSRAPRTRRQSGNVTADISIDSYSDSEEMSSESSSRWLSPKESQMLLRKEGGDSDCCPSILEMTEPLAGTNREGLYVRLFSSPDVKQRFYETSCRVGVVDKPCRFMDRHLHNQSRCVQQYSYSYALVEERKPYPPSGGHHHRSHPFLSLQSISNYSLDYIQIHSGCACVVSPRTKKRRSKSKRGKE